MTTPALTAETKRDAGKMSTKGDFALLDDYTSMQETAYLLRNPHNARHLLQSIAQLEAGQQVSKTLDELDALAQ